MKTNKLLPAILVVFVSFLLKGKSIAHTDDTPANLKFIENKTQWEPEIRFRTNFRGGALWLEKTSFTYAFYEPNMFEKVHSFIHRDKANKNILNYHVIKMNLLGANDNNTVITNETSTDYSNYFLGNDPAK